MHLAELSQWAYAATVVCSALAVGIAAARLCCTPFTPPIVHRSKPRKVRTARTGRTYVVIGGNGTLGSHVVEALLARGERGVRVFDTRPSTLWDGEDNVAVTIGSVTDPAALKAVCVGADTVILTAAVINYWCEFDFEWPLFEEVNVKGTHNVIAACRTSSVTRLIGTSSSSVAVPNDVLDNPVRFNSEDMVANPPYLNHYIKSKVLAEAAVLAANGPNLMTMVVRPGGIYGPRDQMFIKGALLGIPGIGTDSNIIDVTYCENAVHCMLLGDARLENPDTNPSGEAYNVTDRMQDGPVEPFQAFSIRLYSEFGTTYALLKPSWLVPILANAVSWIIWGTRGAAEPYLGDLAKLRPSVVKLARGTYYMSDKKAFTDLAYEPIYTTDEGLAIFGEHHRRTTAARDAAKTAQ